MELIKQSSKYNPEIEKILNDMDKRGTIKTRTVRRLKMSKEDYYNLVQEINKNKGDPYRKPSTHKVNKREQVLTRNKTEANFKRGVFNQTPISTATRVNNSKMVMKNSALNLLMDKAKLNEYMRFTSTDINPDSNEMMSSLNIQDPSKLTFMNSSNFSPTLIKDQNKINSFIQNENDLYYYDDKQIESPKIYKTSRLPCINNKYAKILPRIKSRERKPSEVSVYLHNSIKSLATS